MATFSSLIRASIKEADQAERRYCACEDVGSVFMPIHCNVEKLFWAPYYQEISVHHVHYIIPQSLWGAGHPDRASIVTTVCCARKWHVSN